MLDKLNSLRIGTKNTLLVFLVIVVGSAVSVFIALNLRSIDDTYSALIDVNAKAVTVATAFNAKSDEIGRLMYKEVALTAMPDMLETKKSIDESFASALALSRDLEHLVPQYSGDIENVQAILAKPLRDAVEEVSKATLAGDNDASLRLANTKFDPSRDSFDNATTKLIAAMQKELKTGNDAASDVTNATIRNAYIAMGVGALFALAAGVFLSRSQIVRPIAALTTAMEAVARGEDGVDVPGSERGDEIGAMSRAFKGNAVRVASLAEQQRSREAQAVVERKQATVALADSFEQAVGGIVERVSSAATEMQATAQQLTASAQETSAQSGSVSTAAEEASANVASVAGSAEELGASVGEISRQVERSLQKSRAAVTEAESTAAIVADLSEAAARIDGIVELISGIAGQTNLLALNATIEAARAGEAGRGFAVVASEVKELANQTAKATAEIGQQITGIQATTGKAVTAIGGITQTIREINDAATAIASSVEQQGAATREIVQAVAQASVGTGEVTSNINGVARAAEETGAGATQVLSASSDLARQSEMLRAQVQNFLATVRAA